MTWTKFQTTVLPEAQRIDYYVPRGRTHYLTVVTAVDADAPPLLQWDAPESRNPVSWYVYHGGARPEDFALQAETWHAVSGITRLPARWGDTGQRYHGDGMILVLDGAHDAGYKGHGGLFFPETVRHELHGIRQTLEAYAQQGTIAGKDEPMICGYDLRQGGPWHCLLRVHTPTMTQTYRLDRWD
jgi:hypothetical protein